MNTQALIVRARQLFHEQLLASALTISDSGVPSNADSSNKLSIRIAHRIAEQLFSQTGTRLAGQTSGSQFELIIASYLSETFLCFGHLRPGQWKVERIGNRNRLALAKFEQYAHLLALSNASERDPGLAAALGSDYTITPDVVVYELSRHLTLSGWGGGFQGHPRKFLVLRPLRRAVKHRASCAISPGVTSDRSGPISLLWNKCFGLSSPTGSPA